MAAGEVSDYPAELLLSLSGIIAETVGLNQSDVAVTVQVS